MHLHARLPARQDIVMRHIMSVKTFKRPTHKSGMEDIMGRTANFDRNHGKYNKIMLEILVVEE